MRPNRKRYLLFKVHTNGTLNDKRLSSAIWKSLLSLYGEVGIADCKFYLNQYDDQSHEGILQCNASKLGYIITAAALIETIEGTKVSFEPKKTSGTIKGLHD
jgi:RNase P/RNase MRP subunit POP5